MHVYPGLLTGDSLMVCDIINTGFCNNVVRGVLGFFKNCNTGYSVGGL